MNEKDSEDHSLIQKLIIDQDIENIKMLLRERIRLQNQDYDLAENKIKEFFDYRPGTDEPSIFEYCSMKFRDNNYKNKVEAIIRDQVDTTDGESSVAESISHDELSEGEEEKCTKFCEKELKKKDLTSLRLVAARGVHFSPKFFTESAIKQVQETRDQRHTTFSQSTLFDAGYSADDEINESDKRILKRHKYNLKFIEKLIKTEDRKEVKIGTRRPCKSCNKIQFENLYYRFMQVYINSYSHIFNDKAIKIDFKFDSSNNPLISASWKFDKAAMYASGFRFDWKKRGLRKDPHYRRFTGVPKHPNMGYLDVLVFDVGYVRENGFDRQLMCEAGAIKLSSLYRSEAEIIFHSMIPAAYHMRRYIISLPSFEKEITSLPDKKSPKYMEAIELITKKTATSLATIIENTTRYRLFKSKAPKVIVYDHGDQLCKKPFKL